MKRLVLMLVYVFCVSLAGVCDEVKSATKEVKAVTIEVPVTEPIADVKQPPKVYPPDVVPSGKMIVDVTEYNQMKETIKSLEGQLSNATTNIDVLISVAIEAKANGEIQRANGDLILSNILKLNTLAQVKNVIRSVLLKSTGSIQNVPSGISKK